MHHDKDGSSPCSWAKHQYVVCSRCYSSSPHTKQHLRKVRPYDPLAAELDPPLTATKLASLKSAIEKLQKSEDDREDVADGGTTLKMLSHMAPDSLTKRLLPFGNVHAAVTFGPLVFEIGVREYVSSQSSFF